MLKKILSNRYVILADYIILEITLLRTMFVTWRLPDHKSLLFAGITIIAVGLSVVVFSVKDYFVR